MDIKGIPDFASRKVAMDCVRKLGLNPENVHTVEIGSNGLSVRLLAGINDATRYIDNDEEIASHSLWIPYRDL